MLGEAAMRSTSSLGSQKIVDSEVIGPAPSPTPELGGGCQRAGLAFAVCRLGSRSAWEGEFASCLVF